MSTETRQNSTSFTTYFFPYDWKYVFQRLSPSGGGESYSHGLATRPDSAVIPSPSPVWVLERVSAPGGVTAERAPPRSSLSAGLARPQLRHRDDSETPITTA